MSKLTLFVLTCAALLCGAPAFAIDGQVLINQSTVMAAGGFPYKITQPGSYKLSGNLVVPAGTDGIDILADNVTLDLNGFSISSTQTCSYATTVSCTGQTTGSGVYSLGYANTAVKNGAVTGLGAYGVHLQGTGGTGGERVEEVSASQDGTGINVDGGIVRRCTATVNRTTGISVEEGVVQDNETDENGLYGIFVVVATVTGNEAYSNAWYGLYATDGLYGGNQFYGSGVADVHDAGGSLSQHNNSCTDTSC